MGSYAEIKKIEHEHQVTLAYMTALWTAQWFSKEHPDSLSKILGTKKTEPMSSNQMLAQVKMLHVAFGGE